MESKIVTSDGQSKAKMRRSLAEAKHKLHRQLKSLFKYRISRAIPIAEQLLSIDEWRHEHVRHMLLFEWTDRPMLPVDDIMA